MKHEKRGFETGTLRLTVIHNAARVYHNTGKISVFFLNLTYGTMGLNVLGY